jgi:hypothetical protein
MTSFSVHGIHAVCVWSEKVFVRVSTVLQIFYIGSCMSVLPFIVLSILHSHLLMLLKCVTVLTSQHVIGIPVFCLGPTAVWMLGWAQILANEFTPFILYKSWKICKELDIKYRHTVYLDYVGSQNLQIEEVCAFQMLLPLCQTLWPHNP